MPTGYDSRTPRRRSSDQALVRLTTKLIDNGVRPNTIARLVNEGKSVEDIEQLYTEGTINDAD